VIDITIFPGDEPAVFPKEVIQFAVPDEVRSGGSEETNTVIAQHADCVGKARTQRLIDLLIPYAPLFRVGLRRPEPVRTPHAAHGRAVVKHGNRLLQNLVCVATQIQEHAVETPVGEVLPILKACSEDARERGIVRAASEQQRVRTAVEAEQVLVFAEAGEAVRRSFEEDQPPAVCNEHGHGRAGAADAVWLFMAYCTGNKGFLRMG